MPANDRIYRASILHQVLLERLSNGTIRRILKLIDDADQDIVATLQARLAGLSGPDLTRLADGKGGETQRLARLLGYIRSLEAAGRELLQTGLADDLAGVATYEAEFQQRLLQGHVAAQIALPAVSTLEAAVNSRPFQGRVLREWASQWGRARKERVLSAIRLGALQGEGERAVGRRIRDELNISRRSARMIARTAHTHIANYARQEIVKRNKDNIRGERWTSVLDSRTSSICRARDGIIYEIGKGPRPPAHPNCRSIMTTLLKDDPDDVVGETYTEWFDKLPNAGKREILGTARFRLYQQGELGHADLVNLSTGREWTLAELRKREPEAFSKAFPD